MNQGPQCNTRYSYVTEKKIGDLLEFMGKVGLYEQHPDSPGIKARKFQEIINFIINTFCFDAIGKNVSS